MPSIRVVLPEELAEKVEREALDSGDSRQRIIQSIIKERYSLVVPADSEELRHKAELLEAALRENEVLRKHVDLLQGVSVLIMTGQLRPTDDTVSLWTRFRRWIRR
jgi:hypothetical protein